MRRVTTAVSIFALTVALASPAFPQSATGQTGGGEQNGATADKKKKRKSTTNEPALITADQIINDRDLDTVTASGHVEIDQSGNILLADAVSYNLKQDVIIATGNVSLTQPSGEVTFADYIELTGDMKDATARHLRLLMADDSRMVASTGQQENGERQVLYNALYTACRPCAEDPQRPPLWDIRANRIVHDETTHQITYRDAVVDAYGIPVLYTPYLSHADPTIKRESGVLAPGFINNRIIGTGIRLPYYQVIDANQDLLIDPMYTSNEGAGLSSTYRLRAVRGEMDTSASVAQEPAEDNPNLRTTGWSLSAYSRFDIDDNWRAGYDIERASDRDYLRYYDYNQTAPFLTSRPYLEGFGYRSYAAIEAYSFQNQTDTQISPPPGVPDKTAIVLPLVTYSYQSPAGWEGNYWTFDTHAASILRGDNETNTRRVNTLSAWHVPYTARDGEVFNFTAQVRADAYNSDHVVGLTDQGAVDAYRVVPQAAVDWRYPLVKEGTHSTQTFTPILMANIGPNSGNSAKIPNEDSLDFELDDANIFSPNLFTGYDRVAAGPRIAYGGEYNVANRGEEAADLLIGQSYQPTPQQVFTQGSGLDGHVSDVVGRAEVAPSPDLHLDYRFRFDKDTFGVERSEVDSTFGPRPLNAQIGYVFLNKTSSYLMREQVVGTVTAQLTRHWSVQVYDNQDLGADNGGPLQTGARVSYEDECLIILLDAGERHTTINTITAGHYATLRIVLKTLTQFPVNLF